MGFRGWAFAAATKNRDFLLGYAEKDCPKLFARTLHPYDIYKLTLFDPRSGEWKDDNSVELEVDCQGQIALPNLPSNTDWGFELKRLNDKYLFNPMRDFTEQSNQYGIYVSN